MDFIKELKLNVDKIDSLISQALPSESGLQKRLIGAMNYGIMSGGGKEFVQSYCWNLIICSVERIKWLSHFWYP